MRSRAPRAGVLVLLVVLPFWTSFLIRVYAWVNICSGVTACSALHRAAHPRRAGLLARDDAHLGSIPTSPFMVLPLYAALEKMDDTLLEAASDLGCAPWRAFLTVTVPLSACRESLPTLLCFIPIMGEFVIPDLLGSSSTANDRTDAVARVLRQPRLAGRLAVVLLVILLTPILIYREARVLEAMPGKAETSPSGVATERTTRMTTRGRLASISPRWRSGSRSSTADRHPGDQLVQQFAPRHGVGRMVAALVSSADERRGHAGGGIRVVPRRVSVGDRRPFPERHRGARAHARRPLPRALALSGMIYAPLVMPEVITGLALLLLYSSRSRSTAGSGPS